MELPTSMVELVRFKDSAPEVGEPTRTLKYPFEDNVLTVCSSSYKIQVFAGFKI